MHSTSKHTRQNLLNVRSRVKILLATYIVHVLLLDGCYAYGITLEKVDLKLE